jgi:hypothetical protein
MRCGSALVKEAMYGVEEKNREERKHREIEVPAR